MLDLNGLPVGGRMAIGDSGSGSTTVCFPWVCVAVA